MRGFAKPCSLGSHAVYRNSGFDVQRETIKMGPERVWFERTPLTTDEEHLPMQETDEAPAYAPQGESKQ